MGEKTLQVNNGGQQPPAAPTAGDETKPEVELDSVESEADRVLSQKDDDTIESEEYEHDNTKVVVPKDKFEKAMTDKKTYKGGLQTVKEKLKEAKEKLKSSKGQKDPEKPKDEPKPGEYITRTEVEKANEKEAISEATKDPIVDQNWEEIVKYYSPRHGRASSKDILRDIEDAKTLWEKNNPDKAKPKDGDGGAAANLAADKAKGNGGSGAGGSEEKKGGILPKKTTVKEWY